MISAAANLHWVGAPESACHFVGGEAWHLVHFPPLRPWLGDHQQHQLGDSFLNESFCSLCSCHWCSLPRLAAPLSTALSTPGCRRRNSDQIDSGRRKARKKTLENSDAFLKVAELATHLLQHTLPPLTAEAPQNLPGCSSGRPFSFAACKMNYVGYVKVTQAFGAIYAWMKA